MEQENVPLPPRPPDAPLKSPPRIHPFLPTVSLVLLGVAVAGGYFLRHAGAQPAIAPHRSSVVMVIAISLLFGGGVAFWLRRFGLRYPWIAALVSTVLVLGLWWWPH